MAINQSARTRGRLVANSQGPTGGTEKITINIGFVDLGNVDLLVGEGFFTNRTDFIRTAIRNQLKRYDDAVATTIAHRQLSLGLRRFSKADLAAVVASGAQLEIQVLGLAVIDDDVSPKLARAAIARVDVLGAFHASAAVKNALADRIA
jgi:Arc/MetJ-type ribon-helix-helix transcriptional regulator